MTLVVAVLSAPMRPGLCFPYPALGSGRLNAAPLGESGGAGRLVGCRGSGDGAPSESDCGPRHGLRRISATFTCAESATLPARSFKTADANSPPVCRANAPSRGHRRGQNPFGLGRRTEACGHDDLRTPMPLHGFLAEFQCRLTILRSVPRHLSSRRPRPGASANAFERPSPPLACREYRRRTSVRSGSTITAR